MASKMIGFRCPDDLAKGFEEYCEGADKTSGEVLRKLVDDLLYPPSAELASPDQLYGVKGTAGIIEIVNAQIRDQLGPMVDERLELIQVDRALTEAERESLANLEGELTKLKAGTNGLVQVVNDNVEAYEGIAQTVNKNVELCNESFNRISRLFQFLDAHTHDGAGMVNISDQLAAEVALADKRVGELDGKPGIIKGKTDRPGYRYFEHLDISVKET